jgi:transcriptional regulator with XRE-family HTH domain
MNPAKFGEFIKTLRKVKGLTLTELSKASNVSQSHLSHVENGKRGIPSPEILHKLAAPLGTTHADLMIKAGHVRYEDWFKSGAPVTEQEFDEIFTDEMLGYTPDQKLEILRDLKKSLEHYYSLYYNGHKLTNQDKQRILDMLKVLFPDYSNKE